MMQRTVGRHGRISLVLAFLAAPAGAQHEGHHMSDYGRKVVEYEIPDVTLLNQQRQKVRLKEAIASANEPVMLDFIFGSCTTICPVLSAGFSNLQKELGEEADRVTLISISIDPEHDTPGVMNKYLERYKARPGWQFLTGSRADIDTVMKAFDAFVADKMSHRPLTFLKAPDGNEWIRIDGLVGAATLMEEYEKLLKP